MIDDVLGHHRYTMGMAEATTILLAAMTAGIALWHELGALWPWALGAREPLVI
jgi:hypothetical protein